MHTVMPSHHAFAETAMLYSVQYAAHASLLVSCGLFFVQERSDGLAPRVETSRQLGVVPACDRHIDAMSKLLPDHDKVDPATKRL